MDDLLFTDQQKRAALQRISATRSKWDASLNSSPVSTRLYAIAGMFDSLIVQTPETLQVLIMGLQQSTKLQDTVREAAMLLDGVDKVNA